MTVTDLVPKTPIRFEPFLPQKDFHFPVSPGERDLELRRQKIYVRGWQEFMRDRAPKRVDQSEPRREEIYIVPCITHITRVWGGNWGNDIQRVANVATSMVQWLGTIDGNSYLKKSIGMHDMARSNIERTAGEINRLMAAGKSQNEADKEVVNSEHLDAFYDVSRSVFLSEWQTSNQEIVKSETRGGKVLVPSGRTSITNADRIHPNNLVVLSFPEYIAMEPKHISVFGYLREIPAVSGIDKITMCGMTEWFAEDEGRDFLDGCLAEIASLEPRPRQGGQAIRTSPSTGSTTEP